MSKSICLAALALATATAALAAPTATDPLTLVLERSDFPAGAKWTRARMPVSFEKGLAAAGVPGGRGAFASASLPKGAAKSEAIDGMVVVLTSPAAARRTFTLFKRELAPRPRDVVRLPAYGNEQVAVVTASPVAKGLLLVRKGAVVWQLEVRPEGLLVLTRTQLVAELEKYAAKQKAAVR